MRAVAVSYAGLLVLGALGVIAMGVHAYGQSGIFIVTGAALLMGAVVFFWALRQGRHTSGNPSAGTRTVKAFLRDPNSSAGFSRRPRVDLRRESVPTSQSVESWSLHLHGTPGLAVHQGAAHPAGLPDPQVLVHPPSRDVVRVHAQLHGRQLRDLEAGTHRRADQFPPQTAPSSCRGEEDATEPHHGRVIVDEQGSVTDRTP